MTNEVEKEVREILKKEFCSNACELYSKCVEECLDQATTEIMGIINKIKPPLRNGVSPELWCKTYDENNLLRSNLVEKEKEIKQLMVFLKQTGAVQDQNGNWECTECEPVEENKRLRKELEQALKGT